MTHVSYEIIEPFTHTQLFDLVNDINAYPQFIPDCVDAKILQHEKQRILAYIEIEKLNFKKRFTTENKLNKPFSIEMSLVEGPFKQLHGNWSFIPVSDDQCKVIFDLNFEFKNKLLDLAFTPLFSELMKNMVKAFSNRAKQIYS